MIKKKYDILDCKWIISERKPTTLKRIKLNYLLKLSRIGSSIYYWSLPSKALSKRQEQIAKIQQGLADETARNQMLKQRMEAFQSSQDDDESRSQLTKEYQELLSEQERFKAELNRYKDNDPVEYNQMKANIDVCKKACNRWIENIFSLKSWLKNKFRIQEELIDKQFEIPSDLDYVNWTGNL